MNLYAITPPDSIPDEGQRILALLECGVTRVHLRKPHDSEAELRSLLSPLVEAGFANRLVLHSHFPHAQGWGVSGLHMKESMHRQGDQRLWPGHSLSVSLHDWPSALELEIGEYQYAFISPIFPSISKPGYAHDELLLQAADFLPRVRVPMVALGGVNGDTALQAKRVGFHGVAMLGALFLEGSIGAVCALAERILRL